MSLFTLGARRNNVVTSQGAISSNQNQYMISQNNYSKLAVLPQQQMKDGSILSQIRMKLPGSDKTKVSKEGAKMMEEFKTYADVVKQKHNMTGIDTNQVPKSLFDLPKTPYVSRPMPDLQYFPQNVKARSKVSSQINKGSREPSGSPTSVIERPLDEDSINDSASSRSESSARQALIDAQREILQKNSKTHDQQQFQNKNNQSFQSNSPSSFEDMGRGPPGYEQQMYNQQPPPGMGQSMMDRAMNNYGGYDPMNPMSSMLQNGVQSAGRSGRIGMNQGQSQGYPGQYGMEYGQYGPMRGGMGGQPGMGDMSQPAYQRPREPFNSSSSMRGGSSSTVAPIQGADPNRDYSRPQNADERMRARQMKKYGPMGVTGMQPPFQQDPYSMGFGQPGYDGRSMQGSRERGMRGEMGGGFRFKEDQMYQDPMMERGMRGGPGGPGPYRGGMGSPAGAQDQYLGGTGGSRGQQMRGGDPYGGGRGSMGDPYQSGGYGQGMSQGPYGYDGMMNDPSDMRSRGGVRRNPNERERNQAQGFARQPSERVMRGGDPFGQQQRGGDPFGGQRGPQGDPYGSQLGRGVQSAFSRHQQDQQQYDSQFGPMAGGYGGQQRGGMGRDLPVDPWDIAFGRAGPNGGRGSSQGGYGQQPMGGPQRMGSPRGGMRQPEYPGGQYQGSMGGRPQYGDQDMYSQGSRGRGGYGEPGPYRGGMQDQGPFGGSRGSNRDMMDDRYGYVPEGGVRPTVFQMENGNSEAPMQGAMSSRQFSNNPSPASRARASSAQGVSSRSVQARMDPLARPQSRHRSFTPKNGEKIKSDWMQYMGER